MARSALARSMRAKRLEQELSQEELAQMLEVGRSTIIRVEGGNVPGKFTALALAQWLGWSRSDVIEAAKERIRECT